MTATASALVLAAAFMHAVWNQWEEDAEGDVHNSDMWFRRVMFLDDVENETPSGGGGGGGGGGEPGKKPKKK